MPSKEKTPDHQPRLLIYRVGHLGDTIIALPALRAIRQRFPTAHITLLSNRQGQSGAVGPTQVIPNNGLVNEWLTYQSDDERSGFLNLSRLLMRLRRRCFDTLIYLAPRIRRPQDVRRDLVFFRLAGIRKVIGSRGFVPLPSKDQSGTLPSVEHEADHLLQRLSLDGLAVPEAGQASLDLELTDAEIMEGRSWVDRNCPKTSHTAIVAFGPGSKWPSKIWPEDSFAGLGTKLIESLEIFPVVFGGREDIELGNRLIKAWGRGANAAGVLSVRFAAAALSHALIYVGNDTGTMHLAAAVGTPCVAIVSAQDWPGHWRPYGNGHSVLRRSVPCEGCLLEVCVNEDLRCLKEISVDDVASACERLLHESRARSAIRKGFEVGQWT
jgi:ADP-heptose:LPS heptosyltransferase